MKFHLDIRFRVIILMICFIIYHFIANSIFLDYTSLSALLFYYVIIVLIDLFFTYKKSKFIVIPFFYWCLSFLAIISVEPYLINLENNYNNETYNVLSITEKTFKEQIYIEGNIKINDDCKKIIKNSKFIKVKILQKSFFNNQIFEIEDKGGSIKEINFKLSKQNNKVIYNFSCY